MTALKAVQGRFRLEPTAGFGFPWADLWGPDGLVAGFGRFSAINLFLLRGQRIVLVDGRSWRLKGLPWHQFVCPALFDAEGRRLATSAPGHGTYAVTCRDRGFTLIPAEKRPGRPRLWQLMEFGEPVARIRRNPYEAEVETPIPLPALAISFGLAAFGVMGEKDLTVGTSWAAPQSG